jgi:hypothetical protein
VFEWRRLRVRRVVVNLKTDKAFRGALVVRRGTLLFLRDAVLLEPRHDPVKVDGVVVIDRANVDFLQVLP